MVIASAVLFLILNQGRLAIGLNGLPLDTPWPDNRQKIELEIPSSYDSQIDTLISLEDAYNLYLSGDVIFLDAREEEEYAEGHIKGALNLPFEFWDDYWEGVEPYLDPQKDIVTYCGGLDCELSLFEARELKTTGYEKVYTFFGGWQQWEAAGLPIAKTETDNE